MAVARRAASPLLIVAVLTSANAGAQDSASCVLFSAKGGGEDRILVPVDDNEPGEDQSTPLDVGEGSFTIEFWMRGETVDNPAGGQAQPSAFGEGWRLGHVLIDRRVEGSARGFGISVYGGRIRFGTGASDFFAANLPHTLEGSRLVLDGAWHHVACVRDAASGRKSIYVDGALDIESAPLVSTDDLSHPDSGPPFGSDPRDPYLAIGAEKYDLGPKYPSFAGAIDEIRIWNVARSAAQIAACFDRVLPATEPGLVARYRMEEGAGTTIQDSSLAGSPAAELVAGEPGNGQWVTPGDPGGTAPVKAAPLPEGFELDVIDTSVQEPIALRALPDGRVLVAQRNGLIWSFLDPPTKSPVIQVPADTSLLERGLLGMCVDPDFDQNGWFYVAYVTTEPRARVSRFTLAGGAASASSEVVLWENSEPAGIMHFGGGLVCTPGGDLFILTGDQGIGSNAQTLSNQHGKILRIRKDGSVPEDNPFSGVPGADPRIWALGVRNPFRAVSDGSGSLYFGDVGGNTALSFEEINRATAGANYGWPDQEGETCYTSTCVGFAPPLFSYRRGSHTPPSFKPHSCVVLGPRAGHPALPAEFQDSMFFGDYSAQFIRRAVFEEDGGMTDVPFFLQPDAGLVVDLDLAADGSLWIAAIDGIGFSGPEPGKILRVRPPGPSNAAPVALAGASKTEGKPPLAVHFSSAGSFDPGGEGSLAYFWDFGDGQTSSAPNPTHVYEKKGVYPVTLRVSDGAASSTSAPIEIQVGKVPSVKLKKPKPGVTFAAGDEIHFKGKASTGQIQWDFLLRHKGSAVALAPPVIGKKKGSFKIPSNVPITNDSELEVRLTATTKGGLHASASVILAPRTAPLVVDSVPSGLPFSLDGQPAITPYVESVAVGSHHTIEALEHAGAAGQPWSFLCWNDGKANPHSVIVPADALVVTAFSAPEAPITAALAVPADDRNAGHVPGVGQVFDDPALPGALGVGKTSAGDRELAVSFQSPLPSESPVMDARLELVAAVSSTEPVPVRIHAFDAGDLPPFAIGSPAPPSSHAPLTADSVTWTIPALEAGVVVETPDLSGLIQSVVVRPDYDTGHHLGLVLIPEEGPLDAPVFFRNHAAGQPARLDVTYGGGPAGVCEDACGFQSYGNGATKAHVLGLFATGDRSPGGVVTLTATGAKGDEIVFTGSLAAHAEPILGGVLLVDPDLAFMAEAVVAPDGSASLEFPLSGLAPGAELYFQASSTDPAQKKGFAFSNGLKLVVCP